ncbi:MAG: DNA repair protein RadA [Cyclobacteriaceae bacterium]|nr:DNA repair protein RadA [Cyclobacteriaceae bacterium]MCH8517198.1 DNA repair protein RadA [Cyclobacteriaceae bacterium]
MAKSKTVYFCQSCGNESPKWMGKCPACGAWNSFVEEIVSSNQNDLRSVAVAGGRSTSGTISSKKSYRLQDIEQADLPRMSAHDQELNRVLGGGIVPGSLILIGGEPGIGKSTLLLQIALRMGTKKVLYVSGEESAQQIKMRADRMPHQSENCYLFTENNTLAIFNQAKELKPDLLVIDSIQTLYTERIESAAGSVSQVRECTAELMKFAKQTNLPVFIIGHITKEGSIAGPKVLEHMVDTVLHFEGDRHMSYRILRTTKNRFGPTFELGIYEMMGNGLREVSNPSELLISQRDSYVSGVSIGATLEGNRSLMVEVQALVSIATYGTPQRSTTGYDGRRLNMLLAVLEKRAGFRLGNQDVFLNIAGGLKVEDPAMDLAVCAAIISSMQEKEISNKICFAAEVGLSGEIRTVNHLEKRILEAEKLGFDLVIISTFGLKSLKGKEFQIKLEAFSRMSEVVKFLV